MMVVNQSKTVFFAFFIEILAASYGTPLRWNLKRKWEDGTSEPPTSNDPMPGREYSAGNRLAENWANRPPYGYSNINFICAFAYFPSHIFTYDSIKTRFESGLLGLLPIDTFVDVLTGLMNSVLKISKSERVKLVEMLFGHIDFDLEKNFTVKQVVSIVRSILQSEVPECFEQVFLTCKMWRAFTPEEQNEMIEDVLGTDVCGYKIMGSFKRNTLVMLYLFVLNKVNDNSDMCEALKDAITLAYGKTQIDDSSRLTLKDILLFPAKYSKKYLVILKVFDNCLLDLPSVLAQLKDDELDSLKYFVRNAMFSPGVHADSGCHGLKYKIHFLYILAKFVENDEVNTIPTDEMFTNVNLFTSSWLDISYIIQPVRRWLRLLLGIDQYDSELIASRANELRNASGVLRMIVHSKKYNLSMFLKLRKETCYTDPYGRLYVFYLFAMTKQSILREFEQTNERKEHTNGGGRQSHVFQCIENAFMYNACDNFNLKQPKHTSFYAYALEIDLTFKTSNSINDNVPRESYLYQWLVFNPHFKFYKDNVNIYVNELMAERLANNENKRVQIIRNLAFNKYYRGSVLKHKNVPRKLKDEIKQL